MALGEIGNSSVIPGLEDAYKAGSQHIPWLKFQIEQAIKLIKGEVKRSGKVYVYSFGEQTTRTDCVSGKTEIVK